MNSVNSSLQSLREMFVGKTQEFIDEIENVHMVWLQEIQQEADRMFSRYLELKRNVVVFFFFLIICYSLCTDSFKVLLTNVFLFFSSDFTTEPELMPKTPSQKKNSRRRRVSVGHQEENQTRRRFDSTVTASVMDSLVKILIFSFPFFFMLSRCPDSQGEDAATSVAPP